MTPPTVSFAAEVVSSVHAALSAQRIEAAIDLAEQGLASGVADPLLFNLAAHRQQVGGRFDQALALLEKAQALAPNDVFVLCAIGGNLSQQGLEAQALELYRRALTLEPDHPPALYGLGLALGALNDAEGAWRALHRAVELAPDYAEALGALADYALRRKEITAAEDYAGRALSHDPAEPSALLTLAFLELRQEHVGAAARRLQARLAQGGLAPLHLGAFESLLGEALDKLGRPQEAFQAHARSNAATWSVHERLFARSGVETGTQLCHRLSAYFSSADPGDWATPAQTRSTGASPAGHVFLVGFVRSGTTLLEQVLASHPDVVALEEQPLLRGLGQPFFRDAAGLDRLAALGAKEADALREQYWDRVRSYGVEPDGKVFIDKNPLDIIWAPLVMKLFPNARFLLARRDPRDVVVSSFRHRFIVNALTCAFTGLERTAEFYSEVMALTEVYRARLPLRVHLHVHEELVADFDREVRSICAFLGLEWVDAMRDFAATAQRRDIRTPSADQVRQGLSREGLGRWRRYQSSIEPILPVLQPWVEAFGYAARS